MVLLSRQDHTSTAKPHTVMTGTTAFLPGLSPVKSHAIHARFDGGALSPDGAVLVLRELERQLKFAEMIAGCMTDKRDPASIVHTQIDMSTLRHDPALKMACEHLPASARLAVRRRGFCVLSSVISGATGRALPSPSEAMGIMAAPKSWSFWRKTAIFTFLDSRAIHDSKKSPNPGVRMSPRAVFQVSGKKKCGAFSRRNMAQKAGRKSARSLLASRPLRRVLMFASSSPICRGAVKTSMKKPVADAAIWKT